MDQHRNRIRRIMVTVNVIAGIYDRIAKRLGMKGNTLALLYALDDGRSHSQKEICEEWFIPKTTLNTVVKECVEAGYIVLRADPHKKEKKICLTESGRIYARDVLIQVYAQEGRAMERTLRKVPPNFIDDLELFAVNLKEEEESV